MAGPCGTLTLSLSKGEDARVCWTCSGPDFIFSLTPPQPNLLPTGEKGRASTFMVSTIEPWRVPLSFTPARSFPPPFTGEVPRQMVLAGRRGQAMVAFRLAACLSGKFYGLCSGRGGI